MSADDACLRLHLPPDLREALRSAAALNGRSEDAEAAVRLADILSAEPARDAEEARLLPLIRRVVREELATMTVEFLPDGEAEP